MDILETKKIDELAEKYPLGSQDGKGLDTFVCCKLYYPDRRNNPEGYWYITGCSRRGDDVEFWAYALPREMWVPVLPRLCLHCRASCG